MSVHFCNMTSKGTAEMHRKSSNTCNISCTHFVISLNWSMMDKLGLTNLWLIKYQSTEGSHLFTSCLCTTIHQQQISYRQVTDHRSNSFTGASIPADIWRTLPTGNFKKRILWSSVKCNAMASRSQSNSYSTGMFTVNINGRRCRQGWTCAVIHMLVCVIHALHTVIRSVWQHMYSHVKLSTHESAIITCIQNAHITTRLDMGTYLSQLISTVDTHPRSNIYHSVRLTSGRVAESRGRGFNFTRGCYVLTSTRCAIQPISVTSTSERWRASEHSTWYTNPACVVLWLQL